MAEKMSLEGLRYARTVVETGSFSAAARAHGVTQPALSHGIANLEKYLGERLFTRSPRGVVLTPFGLKLWPLIDGAVTAVDGVTAAANQWIVPAGDTIRMGVSPVINPRLVGAAYSAVCCLATLPAPRQLVLREANLAELRSALLADEIDIMVVPSVGPMPRYEHRVIDSEPLVLVEARPGGTAPAALREVAKDPLILMPETCGLTTFTKDLFQAQNLAVRAYPGEASSYGALEEWASLGLGSAMLPESKLSERNVAHRLMLDEEGCVVEIFYEAVWDPNSALAPALADLANRLTQSQS